MIQSMNKKKLLSEACKQHKTWKASEFLYFSYILAYNQESMNKILARLPSCWVNPDNCKRNSCICVYSLKTYGRISCLESALLRMIRKKQTAQFSTKKHKFFVLCEYFILIV